MKQQFTGRESTRQIDRPTAASRSHARPRWIGRSFFVHRRARQCFFALLFLVASLCTTSTTGQATDTQIKGPLTGQSFRAGCPRGSYLVGFSGRAGNWIDQIAPVCAPVSLDKKTFGGRSVGPIVGTSTGGSPQQSTCQSDAALTYFTFWWIVGDDGQKKFVEGINGSCFKTSGEPSLYTAFGHYEPGKAFDVFLKSRPDPDDSTCPRNEFATGFHGRAGQFINALGLICGPLVPLNPGALPASQAASITTAKPTAPTITSPRNNQILVKAKSVFKIEPSPYLTGTSVLLQLTWLNPPAHLKKYSFFQYEAPMSLIGGKNGIDTPDANLYPGTWRMIARINAPKVSDWSLPVQFEYSLQSPALASKPSQASPKLNLPALPPQGKSSTGINVHGCIANFVSRLAGPNDFVCVTPESHQRVQQENATAASRVNPKGAYGPNTCITGYVWREAFNGDVVCVTPQVRALVRQENELAANRRH